MLLTTTIAKIREIVNICGLDSLEYMLETPKGTTLDIFHTYHEFSTVQEMLEYLFVETLYTGSFIYFLYVLSKVP